MLNMQLKYAMRDQERFLLFCFTCFWLLNFVYLIDDIGICFPKKGIYKHSFPSEIKLIDTDDEIYSVSNNQRISRPIVAYLCKKSTGTIIKATDIKHEKRPKYFNISSEFVSDSSAINVSGCESSLPGVLIKLCQNAANDYSLSEPRRFLDQNFRQRCSLQGNIQKKLVISSVLIHENYLIAQGLLHSITEATQDKQYCLLRKIELSTYLSGKYLSVYTNPIKIYNRKAKLNWITKPKALVTANQPFAISLEIVDENKIRITSGIDSMLVVEVTIGYQAKTFIQDELVRDFLFRTSAELAGDDVITSFKNYDRVLHKRATKGLVEFENVVIRDVYRHQFLYLNATLLVPRTWVRQPMDYSDLHYSCLQPFELDDETFQSQACTSLHNCEANQFFGLPKHKLINHTLVCAERGKSDSVLFTALKVSEQIADGLVLVDLNQVNFEFKVRPFRASNETSDRTTHAPLIETLNEVSHAAEIEMLGGSTHRLFQVPSHFEIPGLWVIVVDGKNRRIFSGSDSALTIEAITEPDVKKSDSGFIFQTFRGIGRFFGAVDEIVDAVQFRFTATTRIGKKLRSSLSRPYKITNLLNIGLFGRFNTAGTEVDPDPVTETFAKFAIKDVNNNIHEFNGTLNALAETNLTINLKTYDTEQNYWKTVDMFTTMMAEEEISGTGNDILMGIIGFGDNEIAFKMNALYGSYHLPIVTYREDTHKFILKDAYKSMFSLDWNLAVMAIRIGYKLEAQWEQFIIIDDEDFLFETDFLIAVRQFKYAVTYRITVGNHTNLTREFQEAKKTGTKMIVCNVLAPKQYFVFREAIRNKMAPMHGYVWFSVKIPAKQFDWGNKHPYCAMEPTCTEAFNGMMLAYTIQNTSGYSNDLWYHVNRKFFELNHVDYRGIPSTQSFTIADRFALGYDAVLTYAYALEKLLREKTMFSKHSIARAMNELVFEGLTGAVQFSDLGGLRLGSVVVLSNVDAKRLQNAVRWWKVSDSYTRYFTALLDREKRSESRNHDLTLDDLRNFRHLIEIPIECVPDNFEKCLMPFKRIAVYPKGKLLPVLYLSTYGFVSHTGKLMPDKMTENLNRICLRTELTIPVISCTKSCGGGRVSSFSAKEYKHGVCISHNECRCRILGEVNPNVSKNDFYKLGFSGSDCKHVICDDCYEGVCVAPYKCSCHDGWSGRSCDVPVCEEYCVHGKCVAPNHCECAVGYYGTQCNIILGYFAIGLIFCVIIALIFGAYCIWWLRKRLIARQAIRNLDWLVDWKDVAESAPRSEVPSLVSTGVEYSRASSVIKPSLIKGSTVESSMTATATFIENTAEWKGIFCYIRRFNVESVNVNSTIIRSEISQIRNMKHPHLVRFYGACLTIPNVCILLEVVQKGSLFNILQSSVYNISWSFKYSILKDIASGMEYLHNSSLGSHGNLTSKNCLIDNRWTCKVTGFGVPSLRKIELYEVERLEQIYRSMLWTAPELLRSCLTPRDLGIGNKEGDIYSFGIIVTEICTHESPFDFELQILSTEELIRVLKHFHDPGTMGIKKLLEMRNYDTSKPIRPALTQSQMPDIYVEKKGIEDLFLITTSENPLARPKFKQIITTINEIHPIKGELVQNLIYMLEKYTNHLQDVFNEKVIEIQIEKSKTENLINRLLPSAIAEQMAQHVEVKPELHHNVTIFFSDIVGFTDIAKRSKPMEVVELLNDLYTLFDNIIETFEVYKLETIGDAYCVVSGVPEPVENHYDEIATMALHFLASLNDYPVRHLPEERLQIRIGIHSGSCVAGVLGIKMPRYCIFGEDVTIAQHMEASGAPNVIQISETTARLLDETKNYYMIFKAELSIKFIGDVNVFWLIGKDNLDVTLPTISTRPSQTKLSLISERSIFGTSTIIKGRRSRRTKETTFLSTKVFDDEESGPDSESVEEKKILSASVESLEELPGTRKEEKVEETEEEEIEKEKEEMEIGEEEEMELGEEEDGEEGVVDKLSLENSEFSATELDATEDENV